MRILGAFHMDRIKLCIFDDADVVVSSDIVQRHLMKSANCQIVLISSTIGKTYGIANSVFLSREEEMLNNLSYFFVKCYDEYNKFKVTSTVIDAIFRKFNAMDARVVLFCNVSIFRDCILSDLRLWFSTLLLIFQ